MIGLKYGGFDLQAGGIVVTETDVFSAPPNDIQADELAERDGALIVQQRYKSKRFTMSGHIQAPTPAALLAAEDAFKTALGKKNQAFDVDYGSTIRRYLASQENIVLARAGSTTTSFNVEFLSPDGMGWDLAGSDLLAPTNITTSSQSNVIGVGGSYQAEPLITLTIGSLTGGTSKTVTITNGTTLRGIAIQRTWTAGDVLEIDVLNKLAYVNDVVTDFVGQFPVFGIGDSSLDYLDDFTTRSVTLRATYTKRWL